MKSQIYFGQLKSNKRPILIRRVAGKSMAPRLSPGRLVLAQRWLLRHLKPGDVVIVEHNGREIIKRIERTEPSRVFLIGDNLQQSTDSRHFGWISRRDVVAKVMWPFVHNT